MVLDEGGNCFWWTIEGVRSKCKSDVEGFVWMSCRTLEAHKALMTEVEDKTPFEGVRHWWDVAGISTGI